MTTNIESVVKVCLAQTGKPYVWGGAGPDVFDCSGLFYWSTRQLGIRYSDHYSGDQWRDSQHVSVSQATHTRGALLFEGDYASQHVVMSLGNGKTIEARGRAYGVGSWDISGRPFTLAGLIPGFSYGQPTPVPNPAPTPWPGIYFRLSTPHMGGDSVKWIQKHLELAGFSVGSFGIDGDFGKDTDNATRRFQTSRHLSSDGIVGPYTWNQLEQV